MNYTLGIEECIDKIFAGVLIGSIRKDNVQKVEIIKISKINMARFNGFFPSNIFKDEYAIFYEILTRFNAKTFSAAQLEDIIDTNRDLVLDSPYVDISKYSMLNDGRQATEDELILAFTTTLKEKLEELSNRYIDEVEFSSCCSIFINWYKSEYLREVSTNMAAMMGDIGVEIRKPGRRRTKYQGYDDTIRYYNESMKVIRELSEESRIRTTLINSEWLNKELEETDMKDNDSLLKLDIQEIDESIGELRRGNMLGILGPPKGGKTRFANYIVQNALSKGLNVAVWPLEGSQEEWMSCQVACRIAMVTMKDGSIEQAIKLDSKKILQNKYKEPDIKKEIASAKTFIATSQQCGRLSFINGAAYVEDFLDVLETHYNNENPFDVLVIDSLVNILSKTGKSKVESISMAYMALKSFIENGLRRKVLAVVPAQLKQTVVDFLRKNSEDTIDVTAGGESAETIRTPDEVIGLFSSKDERAAGLMRMYHVASRHSENFQDFIARCYLGCCMFTHLDQ